MRKLSLAAAALCALALAACSIHIPNPFAGPGLTLTGDLGADMPGIEAYAASIKAGVAADAAKVKATFDKLCPYVSQAQVDIANNRAVVQSAAATVTGSSNNGAKMLNNINQGLALGG